VSARNVWKKGGKKGSSNKFSVGGGSKSRAMITQHEGSGFFRMKRKREKHTGIIPYSTCAKIFFSPKSGRTKTEKKTHKGAPVTMKTKGYNI
jgi:hypothetical protein